MKGKRRIQLNPIVGVVGPDGQEIPAGSVAEVPEWFARGLLLDGRASEAPTEEPHEPTPGDPENTEPPPDDSTGAKKGKK